MKIGDKVYCINEIDKYLTVGKFYKVISDQPFDMDDGEAFVIINDCGERHEFSYEKYHNWFLTEIEIRKLKLKKINESSL